jgi:hypothetical protein
MVHSNMDEALFYFKKFVELNKIKDNSIILKADIFSFLAIETRGSYRDVMGEIFILKAVKILIPNGKKEFSFNKDKFDELIQKR